MSDAWKLLQAADHGVLSTRHPTRGVDSVPVCFVVIGEHVAIPIDTIKPKRSTQLGRLRNLERDPRASLLVEHWDRDDWTALWWVRATVRVAPASEERAAAARTTLAAKYPQYANGGIADVTVFEVSALSHWHG